MRLEDIIDFVKENDIPYSEYTHPTGLRQIYVYEKESYEKVRNHPRKYKDLFVPYLRISMHDGRFYIRDCGWVQYDTFDNIIERCKELGGLD